MASRRSRSTIRWFANRSLPWSMAAPVDPQVHEATDVVVEAGMEVVTLVSEVPSSRRDRYVGIDNSAAGGAVATLMGRFAGNHKGSVGIIAGSVALRNHAERMFG